jgi:FkbM family methyltransferase
MKSNNKIEQKICFNCLFKPLQLNNEILKIDDLIIYSKEKDTAFGLYEEIFIEKVYDMPINNCNNILDLGGNVGLSSIRFSKIYPNANIITYEPSNLAYYYLNKNLKENNISNVKTVNKAVLDYNGLINFDVNTVNCGNNIFNNCDTKAFCVTINDVINSKIDLLKMDIEGSEYRILDNLIKNDKIKLIRNMVIEFHTINESNFIKYILELSKYYDFKVTRNCDNWIVIQCMEKKL